MDISEQLRDPVGAAGAAFIITAGYIHIKAKMNNEGKLQAAQYVKPAILNAIMVYFIMINGVGTREKISSESY
tara:strand:- start:7465 stop:7683 length:219 start_codon:yes stop_codon:yes gene_type:complete